jgi:hypothetical protein
MHETYRMLGREHEADLEREALKAHRAERFRRAERAAAPVARRPRRRRLVVALGARFARIG